jgi:hypothetical protein
MSLLEGVAFTFEMGWHRKSFTRDQTAFFLYQIAIKSITELFLLMVQLVETVTALELTG